MLAYQHGAIQLERMKLLFWVPAALIRPLRHPAAPFLENEMKETRTKSELAPKVAKLRAKYAARLKGDAAPRAT